ncbi:helix-turn-helix transcriptional regulator [Roseateles sp.]|uniref:helix-turn-helix domain-containing protein n=1 Tax=Roseateles sp. TaxID=1971397 RepID=UPI003263AF12
MKTNSLSLITPLARAAAIACSSSPAKIASAVADHPAPCVEAVSPGLVDNEPPQTSSTEHEAAAPLASIARHLGQQLLSDQPDRHALAANDEGGGDGDDGGDDAEQLLSVTAAPTERKAALRWIIGRRLRAARSLQGLDQTSAAELLGYVSSAQLSQQESGKRLAPLERIVAAAGAYGVTTDFLLGLSDEPDRDTHRALRAATTRGVRGMLEAATEGVIGLFESHATLMGPAASNLAALVDAGQALQDAIAVLMRCNGEAFEEMRGGATVVRRAADFDQLIQSARCRLVAHTEFGDGLQAQLKRAMATPA